MYSGGINLSETSSNYWHDPAMLKRLRKDEAWHQDPEVEKAIYSRLEALEPASVEISTLVSMVFAYYHRQDPVGKGQNNNPYERLGLKTILLDNGVYTSPIILPLRIFDGTVGHVQHPLEGDSSCITITRDNVKQYLLLAQATQSMALMHFCEEFCQNHKHKYSHFGPNEEKERQGYEYALDMLSFATQHKLHDLANMFLMTAKSTCLKDIDKSKIAFQNLHWHELLQELKGSSIKPSMAERGVYFCPEGKKNEWSLLRKLYKLVPEQALFLTCSPEDIEELNDFAKECPDLRLELSGKGLQDEHLQQLTASFGGIQIDGVKRITTVPHSLNVNILSILDCPSVKNVVTAAERVHFRRSGAIETVEACAAKKISFEHNDSLKELRARVLKDFDARGMSKLKVVVAPALRTFQCDLDAKFDVLVIPPHLLEGLSPLTRLHLNYVQALKQDDEQTLTELRNALNPLANQQPFSQWLLEVKACLLRKGVSEAAV